MNKTVELEVRVGRVEQELQSTAHEIDALRKQLNALQAHLDHAFARLGLL